MRFASDLLSGRRIALAGVGEAIAAMLRDLGAELPPLENPHAEDDALRDWCAAHGPLHGVVVDAGEAVGAAEEAGLGDGLEYVWRVVRAIGVHALIPGGQGGRIVLLGPAPDAGPFAAAATAALESLARTLSVEWARFGVTAVCVARGAVSREPALGSLVAFVLSPAGGYLSGCRFSLGLLDVADPPSPPLIRAS